MSFRHRCYKAKCCLAAIGEDDSREGILSREDIINSSSCNSPLAHAKHPKFWNIKDPPTGWDLGLGTRCEVVSPNFHALNG